MKITRLKEAYVWCETLYTAIYALPSRSCSSACSKVGRLVGLSLVEWGRRGQIPEMVRIHLHSPEIDGRLIPGNWEGDLIKGKANA